jgi:hypothetical protein
MSVLLGSVNVALLASSLVFESRPGLLLGLSICVTWFVAWLVAALLEGARPVIVRMGGVIAERLVGVIGRASGRGLEAQSRRGKNDPAASRSRSPAARWP